MGVHDAFPRMLFYSSASGKKMSLFFLRDGTTTMFASKKNGISSDFGSVNSLGGRLGWF